MDEQAFVDDACQGDVTAFNQLVLRYQGVAYNVAFRILGRADAAEDATQEAFLSAYRAIGTLRGGSFKNWLLRIVTNKCLDQLRTRKRRPTLAMDGLPVEPEYLSHLADPGESPQQAVERLELAQVLQVAILALPPGQRSVVVLADVQGLTYQQVAEVLEISLGTVKSRLSRAQGSLRARLLARRGALPAWIHPVEMRHAESGGAPVDWSFAPSLQEPAFSAGETACTPLTPSPNSPQSNREGAVQFELGRSRSP
jgi:RNA polymerase sigma-70 factor (ECF subfamily)